MNRRRLLPLALLLLALCPAPAAARTYPPVPLPGDPVTTAADGGAVVAVDDRGGVAAMVPQGAGTAAAVQRAPGGPWTIAPLPGIDAAGDVRLTAGGDLVGYGFTATHEDADSLLLAPCCQRPFVFRWRPGTAPARQTVVPLDFQDRSVDAFDVDRDGTAYALLDQVADDGTGEVVTLAVARVPAHGAVARRALPARDVVGFPATLRASERGAGAVVAWDAGGAGTHRLRATPQGWRPTGHLLPSLQNDDQDVHLDPHGGLIHVFQHDGHLMLRDAMGRRRVLGPIGLRAGWQDAVGADGTLAVLWARGPTLYERVLDRRRHLGPARVLGPVVRSDRAITYAVAVDAHGGVHADWLAPDGTIVVQVPGGRRVLSRGAVALSFGGLAVSPGGATAASFVAGTQRLVAVTTRP
jgi:hypothetical protein